MKRKPGKYAIKYKHNGNWSVAAWTGTRWLEPRYNGTQWISSGDNGNVDDWSLSKIKRLR